MSDQVTREELAAKVEWEGGVAEAIIGYGLSVDDLPEDAPFFIIDAWKRVQGVRADIQVIGEWLSDDDGEEGDV